MVTFMKLSGDSKAHEEHVVALKKKNIVSIINVFAFWY